MNLGKQNFEWTLLGIIYYQTLSLKSRNENLNKISCQLLSKGISIDTFIPV